jgi:hypothetical protein
MRYASPAAKVTPLAKPTRRFLARAGFFDLERRPGTTCH